MFDLRKPFLIHQEHLVSKWHLHNVEHAADLALSSPKSPRVTGRSQPSFARNQGSQREGTRS